VYSKMCIDILEILRNEGYIWGFEQVYNHNLKKIQIDVFLKYNSLGVSSIQEVLRVSKAERRVFCSVKSLWKPKTNTGVLILSTPKGMLVDRDARLFNLGGELVCIIF
jgi:small subunit ribosomal protein S8